MKKEVIIEIALAIVLIALLLSIYFGFFYFAKCSDDKCFSESLVKCKRVIYYKDSPTSLIGYKILGENNQECPVNVKIIQIKQGTIEMLKFENQEMICTIPIGTLAMPESNLQNCKGVLRENIQEAMINNLHSQIVDNLNGISIKYNPLNSSVNITNSTI
jgi:hypothetical protein